MHSKTWARRHTSRPIAAASQAASSRAFASVVSCHDAAGSASPNTHAGARTAATNWMRILPGNLVESQCGLTSKRRGALQCECSASQKHLLWRSLSSASHQAAVLQYYDALASVLTAVLASIVSAAPLCARPTTRLQSGVRVILDDLQQFAFVCF